MEATYGENEIKSLIQKARIFNKDIGSYELFAITDNFDYAVKLSNGKMVLKVEELQDDEKDVLTPENLTAIANRFISSSSETNSQEQTTQTTYQRPSITIKPKKKSSLGKIIIIGIISVIVGGLAGHFLLNQINSRNSNSTNTTYQEKVLTVEEIEQNDPASFLKASGTYNQNFWGDAMKVHGTIVNNATVANYKDVVVEVVFYSETETELDRKRYTIYDYFPAHSTKNFELKITKSAGCKKLGWSAIRATPY
jgi:hypothetical protein